MLKAEATAPPVSPEVATSIVVNEDSFLLFTNSDIVEARKRAPKSLKAAVGPWNNSRTEYSTSPSLYSFETTGKLKAWLTISFKSSSKLESLKKCDKS